MKILASKEYNVLRDGGSHMHAVLNSSECGFIQVIRDHSIGSRARQEYGQLLGMLPPPDHTGDKHVKLDEREVSFV